jgi:predicted CXXCH cytochrome family protein
MKKQVLVFITLCMFSFLTFSYVGLALADKQPPEPAVIKIEGAKLPPVSFSHKTHVEKNKLECVKCHHKDKDPKEPEGCVKCHPVAGAQNKAPIAKDAFHKLCQACHKESTAKDVKAPTSCNECHKK